MEGTESLLEAIYEEQAISGDETLDGDDDVEMLDVETLDGSIEPPPPPPPGVAQPPGCDGGGDGGREVAAAVEAEGGPRTKTKRRRANKKKKKNKSKSSNREKDGSAPTITDINRFVVNTCRRLSEKKSYLVWNAVGCLGVDAVHDLVKEVDVIQSCGGQTTADGRRFRNGGGILWNILKTREPKAYKEIMKKGREFEKQFRQTKNKGIPNRNQEAVSLNTNVSAGAKVAELTENSENIPNELPGPALSDPSTGRRTALDRIRIPVAYDDLFEEGEIQE